MSQPQGYAKSEMRPSRFQSETPEPVLSFAVFKIRFGSSQGDHEPTTYDASTEQYPDDTWYTLEHDKIDSGIHNLCKPILRAIRGHSPDDTEVSNLHTALQTASIIPRGQQFFVAFLGEQGMGKSSLINAILNRDLVNVSSGTSACTAFPTIITYKPGASDDTTECDVRVEFLSDDEIRECAQEQARRYRIAFPRMERDEPTENSEDEDEEVFSDNEGSEVDPSEDSCSDDNLSEDDGGASSDHNNHPSEDGFSEDEDDAELTAPSAADRGSAKHAATRPSVLRGAKTAMSFFNIIFATESDEDRTHALQDDLDYLDIEDDSFADICVEQARERLSVYDIESGFGEPETLDDSDLVDFQEVNDKIWPLIKSVRIETGHVLLRNNVGVLDLPGYGDDNHIRTALIDKFREMAHFEIVVAPTSRVTTSMVQERYLNRSIRRLGSRNTLLVTNKSDQLLDDLPKQINKIKEAPFPVIKRHLADVAAMIRKGVEDRRLLNEYRNYLIKEARLARIQHAQNEISSELKQKNVDILSASARQYSLCIDPDLDDEKPKLAAEATGIPELRRYLFHVPAQTNYRTLHYHVFETLPDIVGRITRILEKFDDDEGYAQLREYLLEKLPQVRVDVERLAVSLPRENAVQPFHASGVMSRITADLKTVFQSLCAPRVYYPTFTKMLRENGIPVNGKGLGLNLNQDILGVMATFINGWHKQLQGEIDHLAQKFDEPVQSVLRELKEQVQNYDGNPDLKHQATELLETTTRRAGLAYDKMVALLQAKLRAVHFQYSNEVNIKCPIALEMKEIYQAVVFKQLSHPGAGSYARQRAHLFKCVAEPKWPRQPLPEALEQKIVGAQIDAWIDCLRQYVAEVMALLQEFACATDELIDHGQYLPSNHRDVREQLEGLLPMFKRQLNKVQDRFPGADTSHASPSGSTPKTTSKKRKANAERAASQPFAWGPKEAKRLKTYSQQSRAMSLQPLDKWRGAFGSPRKQSRQPSTKRESSP